MSKRIRMQNGGGCCGALGAIIGIIAVGSIVLLLIIIF